MGALLVEDWLGDGDGDGDRVAMLDEATVSQAREAVRSAAVALGLPEERRERLVTATSELAWNQLRHARRGQIAIRSIARAGIPGLEVIAADRGDGIADPRAALSDHAPGGASLGSGLASVHRLADEVDVDVRLGEGTCVRARTFAAAVPRREVAILGRPHKDERISGDHAAIVWSETCLLAAIADGLGHGPEAREAADRAVVAIALDAGDDPVRLLQRCDTAIAGSRGAAVTIVVVDFAAELVRYAGAGNVSAHLYAGRTAQRFVPTARVVGQASPRSSRQTAGQECPLVHPQLLLMFSDGLSSRLDLTSELELRRRPLIVIAQELLERHGQRTDDALVLVARWA